MRNPPQNGHLSWQKNIVARQAGIGGVALAGPAAVTPSGRDGVPATTTRTGIAYVGCGFVADLYQQTLANWAHHLDLKGVWDRRPDRLAEFTGFHGLNCYASLTELLADDSVKIVVNLTNPASHFEVSQAALLAGKHVYSEKPLALDLAQAETLTALAKNQGLHLVSAPSSVLGDAAQALWAALRRGDLGAPRLVYAELDDGRIHRIGYENWRSVSGAYWPARDEFQTGCTVEHLGYALTWMVCMFGSVEKMVSAAGLVVPQKGPHTPEGLTTPDFSCTVLTFTSGVTARITNSIIAPHDHRFRIFCDEGVLEAKELWDFFTPVRAVPLATTRLRRQIEKWLHWDCGKRLNRKRGRKVAFARRGHPMDFALGIAEMAGAIAAGRAPRLGGDFGLHITEVTLATQYPDLFGAVYHPKSRAQPVAPME